MKIVLAYSGGLDTSAIIPWLKENYENAEIYAFVADVGQDRSDLEGIEQKAIYSGAKECKVVDLKEEFIKNYIYPTIFTGAMYEGVYLLGTSMARPVIAKAMVEYALSVGADAIAHGATGKGNDQVRFEYTINALAPLLKIIAPWRVWSMKSRGDLLDYLASKNIKTTASKEKIYSKDANLWHVSTEGGMLEDPANSYDSDSFVGDVLNSPNEIEKVKLSFEKGYLVAINDEKVGLLDGLDKLNKLGLKHAIGRVDMVENRLVGLKSRGCYETPGGTILNTAIRALEQLVLDRDSLKLRISLGHEMSYLVYDGKWFSTTLKAICKACEVFSDELCGDVVMELYKGSCMAVSKSSKNSIYSAEFVTFDEDEVYNQFDAEGFIKLFSLPAKIKALKKK